MMHRERNQVLVLVVMLVFPTLVSAVSFESETERPSDATQIRAQMLEWDRSLLEGDFDAVMKFMVDEYFGAGVTREQYVEGLKFANVDYTESSRDNVVMRFYGDVALASGQWTQRGKTSQFGSFVSTFSFTEMWVKHKDSWRCAATSPDKARQAFARYPVVQFGPDVRADVVVLFVVGASDDELEEFRKSRLSDDNATRAVVKSFLRATAIERHPTIALQLAGSSSDMQRKLFVKQLLSDPLVFRIFEDIAPDDITLREPSARPSTAPDDRN